VVLGIGIDTQEQDVILKALPTTLLFQKRYLKTGNGQKDIQIKK